MLIKKQQLSLILFITSIVAITAQNKTIYYGTPNAGGAQLHVNEDNTYDIILEKGSHDKIKIKDEEYLFLYNIGHEHEGFKITENSTRAKTDSITIHFMRRNISSSISDIQDVYLGYKTKSDTNFKYVNLCYETLLFNTKDIVPFDFNGTLNITIPRAEEIQLILKKDQFHRDQFKLSPNTSNVYVDYRYIYNKGNIDNNSKLVIAEINTEGGLKINKKVLSTKNLPAKPVKRIASDSFPNWKIPFSIKKEVYKKFNNPKFKYQPVTTISPSSREEKHKEFNNLNEAIATLKSDDSKVLLVFNSLLGNNDIHDFHFIFDRIHRNAKLDYLSDYHLDRYLLYYLKPDDLNELKKYKQGSINEVLAFNSDLDIIYEENISANIFYRKYNSMTEELSHDILATNALHRFKKKIDNKTITAKDFLELGQWRDHSFIEEAIEKRPKDESDILIESTIDVVEPSRKKDTRFKTKIKFNCPKISYTQINKELKTLIKKHKQDQSLDPDFAELAFDFISYYPFFKTISGAKGSYDSSREHYEFCLYLSRFPIETSKIQNEHTKSIEDHFFVIKEILKREGTKKEYPEIVIPTFENLIQLDEYKFHTIFIYYFDLFNQSKLTYNDFNTLFKEIAPLTENYNEQIKSFYDDCHCPYIDDLKYYITALSNAMAWKVVTENNNDKTLLLKALEWSKLTAEVSPESHFYTDTYAHLEYFLGNKERAIELESKAIELATSNNHKNLEEYKKTLEKIKTGTLKY
ncbi:hypothetical protein [Aquimarina algicola]|uniref:Uncharacterized protein n=1 Tax=Aquimarina algicola TaxID=2589995 RepID=A0A504JMD5_9FLAO|nr:hypothetical protein [Aquimarina algicola]TPN87570.1 hypothetical protein FHK87_08290 [Aquimarina algicola]